MCISEIRVMEDRVYGFTYYSYLSDKDVNSRYILFLQLLVFLVHNNVVCYEIKIPRHLNTSIRTENDFDKRSVSNVQY